MFPLHRAFQKTNPGATVWTVKRAKTPGLEPRQERAARPNEDERVAAVGRLTTHVLDTAHGRPAAGLKLALYRLDEGPTLLVLAETNADGRYDGPLLEGDSLAAGRYELLFRVRDYFAAAGVELPDPAFLDEVVIRFGIADPREHYHVPLLLSPYGYSTYRGS